MKAKTSIRLAALALVFFSTLGQMQAQTLKEFFNDPSVPLMYLGIDFTKTKLIDDANANADDIQARQYNGINDLMVDEAKKYDVKGAFHHNNLDHDLGPVAKRNAKIDPNTIKSTNTSDYHRLNEDSIRKLVSGFDFEGKKGIGLILVMEAMSKSDKGSAVWFTLVDMGSKKMLMTDRLEGKAGMGFGFRNYWATTLKNLLDAIEKKKYNEWKSKYGS